MITINNLTKKYGTYTAINKLSLDINEGEIFGLLGPNGAGKTTLISTLLGLNGYDSGEIKIFDKNLSKNEREIKSKIGFVPQDIALYDELTALDNVRFFGRLYGLKKKQLDEKVEQALKFTGLWNRRKDYPTQFSGGMKRRLNIACAIVHEPKLLFMDEPTVGVDPQSRNNILSSIKKLNKMGTTVIYTSHYMEEIEEICSNIAIIDRGEVIARGTSDQLKELVSHNENIYIQIDGEADNVSEEISKLVSVTECKANGRELLVKPAAESENISELLGTILQKGFNLLEVNVQKPTLETVFLELTGKRLRD